MYEIPGKSIAGINNAIEGQDHIERSRSTVSKSKVTKKSVCLSNSIQHLVTECWDQVILGYAITLSPYWVQGDVARAS